MVVFPEPSRPTTITRVSSRPRNCARSDDSIAAGAGRAPTVDKHLRACVLQKRQKRDKFSVFGV